MTSEMKKRRRGVLKKIKDLDKQSKLTECPQCKYRFDINNNTILVWQEAQKDLLEKQIKLLNDLSRDCLDLYELKMMLEDSKK